MPQLSKKRVLHPNTEKEIIALFRDGGYFYPVSHAPHPHITFKHDSDRRAFKNKPRLIVEKKFDKPSIGQLARKFEVNKPEIKRILFNAGLIKENPIENRRLVRRFGEPINITGKDGSTVTAQA